MTSCPDDLNEALAALSAPQTSDYDMSRRRFLQGTVAAGAGVLATPALGALTATPAAAAPADDHLLVLVYFGGGVDGLNMVAPVGQGRYYDRRPNLAVPEADALPVGTGLGLHPSLTGIKSRFDRGEVAIVQGVGYPNQNFSHFDSVAIWWAGNATSRLDTGWLGRFSDDAPNLTDMTTVHIGPNLPLHMWGQRHRGVALPSEENQFFGAAIADPFYGHMYENMRAMASTGPAHGAWGSAYIDEMYRAMDLAERAATIYSGLEGDDLARDLDIAARILNADVGCRVVSVAFGDHDTHASQAYSFSDNMARFNAAVERFYEMATPDVAERAIILTHAEFGRTFPSNDSGGTDHGGGSCLFAIGNQVNGGLYGEYPSLTNLLDGVNLRHTVDFRSVYATVLDSWLGGDSQQILGASYENLGFID